MGVQGVAQISIASFGRGVKQLRGLKQNGRGLQLKAGCLQVPKEAVGCDDVRAAGLHQGKAFLWRLNDDELGPDAETPE